MEIKFLLEPSQHSLLHSVPLLRAAEASFIVERVTSYYYDTPTFDLRQSGYSYRVRKAGERWLQTVKGKGVRTEGFTRRFEWEQEIESENPRFDLLTDPNVHPIFSERAILDQLQPLFVTEFQRTSWRFEMRDCARVEVALDSGEIRAQGRSARISELEIESLAGPAEAVLWVADELLLHVPMVRGQKSKGYRGYELLASSSLADPEDG